MQSWRKRQYFYASATIFREISGPLQKWLHNDRDPLEVAKDDPDLVRRTIALRKLHDIDGLYPLVGDAILKFVEMKRAPFPGALLSKRHFKKYATWKMAFIFVKLMRELTCSHANKHWNKFGYGNYKLNKLCFKYFCDKAEEVWKQCILFKELPDEFQPKGDGPDTPIKQRTRKRFELSSPEGKNPRTSKKAKTVCLLSDSDDTDSSSDVGV